MISTGISLHAAETLTTTVDCSAGKRPTGIGYAQGSGTVAVLELVPLASGWRISLRNLSPSASATVTAYAICVLAN